MAYWLDYSDNKIPGSVIRAAGYTGVIRYIDSPANLGIKHTDLAEYQSHIAAGLEVRLVFERDTSDDSGGYNAGVAYAQRAKAGADYLGYDGVIFFCNDSPTLSNASTWQQYLDGAASVLGKSRVGAYGFFNAMDDAVGHASAFWQAGRRSDLVPHANYWQDNNTQVTVGGVPCDRNLVISDYSTSAPTPVLQETEDMPDRELKPSANGSVTLTVPSDATQLVIGVGWTSTTVTKVGFFGPTPATGVNQLWATSGSQRVDAGRPWAIPVPSGALTAEVDYILTPVAGRDVSGTAGFRK